jgi:hypothetical protein
MRILKTDMVLVIIFFLVFLPTSGIFAQPTTLMLPTNDHSSSFNILQNDSSNILTVFGDGGLFLNSSSNGIVPVEGEGMRLMWHPRKAAFRSGRVQGTEWDEFYVGFQSFAVGRNTIANGENSAAFGTTTSAGGYSSIVTGVNSVASGNISTAMGSYSTASGPNSTAIGLYTSASGGYSTAMGSYVSTNNFDGSFFLGDFSTWDPINGSVTHSSSADNQISMRFAGGYRFFTNSDADVGVLLEAGANSWTTISDSTKKENFIYADGEQFLNNISKLKLGSWNYKTQNEKKRHYGPMAQEIFRYFGKDEFGTIGNDSTLATADIDGIIMICLQALEKRTSELREKEDELKSAVEKISNLENSITILSAEIKELKTFNDKTAEFSFTIKEKEK